MYGPIFQLEIQKFLKSYKNFKTAQTRLKQQFAINIIEDQLVFQNGETEKVWIYNYDKTSTGWNIIENEANGLILNDQHNVVSRTFPRFFNINRFHSKKIDWETSRIEEKLDGLLVVAYGYRKEIFFQTRNSATATCVLRGNKNKTCLELIMEILKCKNSNDPLNCFTKHKRYPSRYSWTFELIGPENKLITPYDSSDLVCLTLYSKDLNSEIPPLYVNSWTKEFGFSRPKTYTDLFNKNKNTAIEYVKNNLCALEEGCVVVDEQYNRVKIRNPIYSILSNHINDGSMLTQKNLATIALSRNPEKTVLFFDKYSDIILLMCCVLSEILDDLENTWYINKNLDSKKEFYEAIKKHPLNKILFLLWTGKIKSLENINMYIKPEMLIKETKNRYPENYVKALEKTI